MTSIDEKLKAIEIALLSFVEYENDDKERKHYLKSHLVANNVKPYILYSIEQLVEEKKLLIQKEILLLQQSFILTPNSKFSCLYRSPHIA